MTELERIEIEGFKGIESLAFEPSGINLITGRNNTGKTSVLEAVNLFFDQKAITAFREHVNTLINVDHEFCSIKGVDTEQDLYIRLRKPSPEEAGTLFGEAILERNPLESLDLPDDSENNRSDNRATIELILRRVLNDYLTDETLSNIRDDILIVEIKGEEFPYIHRFSGRVSEMFREEADELLEAVQEEFDIELDEIDIDRMLTLSNFRFGQDYFVESPPSTNSVKFVDSSNLLEGIEGGDEENEAIRIDDIGDFIREKELVENLKTFTQDYLVFEKEDGEKYQIPFEFMGDGFKSTVGLLWELMDDEVENGIVLIEEPENHMHPGYIREVVRFLIDIAREEDVQLFITTHDNDFINDFFMENLTEEQRTYLEEEFTLLQMEENTAQVLDYKMAEETLKDLHLDLRGL